MDMDFMNLNQSAHGDREFGHILARMRKPHKTVVGYWKDPQTLGHIAVWERVAAAWADAQDCRVIRFGDQMNNVAVTDGDKVEAEMRLGYHVDYMPFSSVMPYFDAVADADVDALVAEYFRLYEHDASLEDKSGVAYRKVSLRFGLSSRTPEPSASPQTSMTSEMWMWRRRAAVLTRFRALRLSVSWLKGMVSVRRVTGRLPLSTVPYGI